MSWALLLLTLFTRYACCRSQPVVTQSASMSVSPGGTVRLPCAMSSGFSIGDYHIYWYQQKPGSAPRYLLRFYSDSDKHQGEGVPSRFSGSKDSSSNSGYLTISGALAEDDADYYCKIWHNNKPRVFGGGTQLNVLADEVRPPSVQLFPPSKEELDTNAATLVCIMTGFYPASLSVSWLADGQQVTSGVQTTRATKQSDNLFMATSYLSVLDWQRADKWICEVTHEGVKYTKTVKRSECS